LHWSTLQIYTCTKCVCSKCWYHKENLLDL
jgi:predicted DsbA family dithiol-disulfide isomerase